MKVTSEVIDIFPPDPNEDDTGTLDDLCSQVFARKCEIVLLRPGFQGTYEVAIRGEEADVRAYIEEVGWGEAAGYVWEVAGDQLVYREE